MALKAVADQVAFTLTNEGRENAVPPLRFLDVSELTHFSFSIWVKLDVIIPKSIIGYGGTNGGVFQLATNGVIWHMDFRQESTFLESVVIGPVTLERWTLFCVVKDGDNFRIFWGTETDPANADVPVVLTEAVNVIRDLDFIFRGMALVSGLNMSICNFKYWDAALTEAELQDQANRWNPQGTPKPIWVSPLRVPTDLSNIANPYHSFFFDKSHQYDSVDPWAALFFVPDPAYIAKHTECAAWIINKKVADTSQFNPGSTPLVPTIYKAPQFEEFLDLGVIPITPFLTITCYGVVFHFGTGPFPSDTWGLFKDENGVEQSNTSNPIYRFEVDTGVAIPGSINSTNLYQWKYGAQFTWQALVPQVPTATGGLANHLLYVTYIGFPTVAPGLPIANMMGLFAIQKDGKSVDRYNKGSEVKIPDPLIRTAFIGE